MVSHWASGAKLLVVGARVGRGLGDAVGGPATRITVGDALAGVKVATDAPRGVELDEGLGEREAVGVVEDTKASTKVGVTVGVWVGVGVGVCVAIGVMVGGSANIWANSTDADCSSDMARALSYWSSRNPKMPIAARPSNAVSTTMRNDKVRFFIECATV